MADKTNPEKVKKLVEQLGGSNRMLTYKEGIHNEGMLVEHEGGLPSSMDVTGDLATSLAGNGSSNANGEQYQRMIIAEPGTFGREYSRILIDSGCTHNILDENVPNMMGCELTDSNRLLKLNLANGEVMNSSKECKGFTWQMQGVSFTADFITLDLQQNGTEMILGVQWLSTLGDVLWNFNTLRMEFWKDGKKVVLEGVKRNPIRLNSQPQIPTLLLSSTEPTSLDCLAATGDDADLILIDLLSSDPCTMCMINGCLSCNYILPPANGKNLELEDNADTKLKEKQERKFLLLGTSDKMQEARKAHGKATMAKRWELGSPSRRAGSVPEDADVSIIEEAVEEHVVTSSPGEIHLPSQPPREREPKAH